MRHRFLGDFRLCQIIATTVARENRVVPGGFPNRQGLTPGGREREDLWKDSRSETAQNAGDFYRARCSRQDEVWNSRASRMVIVGELDPVSDELLFRGSGRGFKSLERWVDFADGRPDGSWTSKRWQGAGCEGEVDHFALPWTEKHEFPPHWIDRSDHRCS